MLGVIYNYSQWGLLFQCTHFLIYICININIYIQYQHILAYIFHQALGDASWRSACSSPYFFNSQTLYVELLIPLSRLAYKPVVCMCVCVSVCMRIGGVLWRETTVNYTFTHHFTGQLKLEQSCVNRAKTNRLKSLQERKVWTRPGNPHTARQINYSAFIDSTAVSLIRILE